MIIANTIHEATNIALAEREQKLMRIEEATGASRDNIFLACKYIAMTTPSSYAEVLDFMNFYCLRSDQPERLRVYIDNALALGLD